MRKAAIIVAIVLFVSALCGCSQNSGEEKAEISFFALDTYISIQAEGEAAEEAVLAAREVVERSEDWWSVTDERSEVYAINHGAGFPRSISKDTSDLIAFSLQIAENTGGAFDPTIYPLVRAWGFTTGEYKVLSEDDIAPLMPYVGYEKVLLQENTITLPDGMMLDFGAVAKGYIGDLVEETLRSYGITSALINLGGNIQLLGRNEGKLWNIGLRSPYKDLLGTLLLEDTAIVTSGKSERFFTGDDGKIYHHIIDPATGRPAENDLLQVSVIGDEGKICDALSTACFVMGKERAIEFWRNNVNFGLILVTEQNEVLITEDVAETFFLNEGSEWTVKIIEKAE